MADLEHSAIRHNDHLLLDQPLLRLPNELLRKNFRAAHFTIEKDTTAVKAMLHKASDAAGGGQASRDDTLRSLDAMVARMRGVKRKLAAHAAEEARLHDHAAARAAHLGDLFRLASVDDVKYEDWSRRRLDRLLADYLLRRGYSQTAAELARERRMEDLVDVDAFVSMSHIRDALLDRNVSEALAWCTENKKELRKMESKFEFMLRFQQYVELRRSGTQDLEAIAHAKKHLIPYRATYPKEVQQVCGLLAFPPSHLAAAPAYAALYDDRRWQRLADLFTETHNALLALPSVPLLHIALSSGLSALKTPACHAHHARGPGAGDGQAGVCPICSTELNELARNVPYAHHTKSHVEHDLMLLPSGRVCGRQRLDDGARKAGLPPGTVRDPRSGEAFPVDDLKKVYIT